MAESTLSLTYSDIQYEVGKFLGWDRTAANWTAAQNTDFTYILKRGLRLFYFPPSQEEDRPYYEWSFLRATGNTTLTNANAAYVMPDSFGGTILDFSATYAVGSGRRRLSKVPEGELRSLQAMDNLTKQWPKYYAIRNNAVANTGQRFEMLVYPTPGADQVNAVITYSYVSVPDVLTNTTVYPCGGGQYSEVLLSAILSAAEAAVDDDAMGPNMQRFQVLLSSATRDDKNKKASGRGGNV
jgi:hypothetical protein